MFAIRILLIYLGGSLNTIAESINDVHSLPTLLFNSLNSIMEITPYKYYFLAISIPGYILLIRLLTNLIVSGLGKAGNVPNGTFDEN
jgi:hypothetical protein